MSLRDKPKFSLQARFVLAISLSIVSFVVIALILMVAFAQVRSNIGEVVEVQIRQTVDNSRLSRELGGFFSRLALLEATFYGNDEFLKNEGTRLLQEVKHHDHSHVNESLIELHQPLYAKLAEYLQQCEAVNALLNRLAFEESGLDDAFVLTEEVIAERILQTALRGEQSDYYDQLTIQLAGFRILLLEIIQLNSREHPQELFSANLRELPASAERIADLTLRLKRLAASEYPINRLGRHLIDQLKYYQHLLYRFQQEMIHLGKRSSEMKELSKGVLAQMEMLDMQHTKNADQTRQNIDETILSTVAIVWLFLGALALLLGIIQLNLYRYHIKRPMETVRRRLLEFQDGDYKSPMTLGRNDEWSDVEIVFNDMLGDLTKSWTAVQESERRYRKIFASVSIGIFQSTLEGAFLNINPAFATMLGIDADAELSEYSDLGKMIYADPQDRQDLLDRLMLEENVSNFEVRMRRKNDEIFWVSLHSHLVRDADGNIQFIEGTVDDISHRRVAEKELLTLKEYLHDIIDTMPSILIGVTGELKVSLWNRQVAELSGIPALKAFGQPLADIFDLLDDARFIETVQKTLKTGEVVRERKIPGSGQAKGRFFDLMVYPLSAVDSTGAVLSIDDVTEKAQIEAVMVQSEKMLSVGNLAAGMAHEINNPLASVLQNVQVMDQRLSPSLDKNRKVAEQLGISIEQVAEYAQQRGFHQMIKSIAESGQRAARIIENMLNFSRKSTSNFLPCSLAELTEKTIELASSDYDMKHHFDFRRIKMVRDYQAVPDVPCESSQIQQVILNLLKNAAQAIGAEAESPEIQVRVFARDKMVCLQIEDNGDGMDEQTCRRIFEPFYTTKDVGRGTGLGLSVAYFLITENHKGKLTVSSEPGQGSCFNLLLPIER